MKKYYSYIIGVILIGLFLFLRLYHLPTSFFFLNDMGRDMLVLKDWQDTGKPPLLGPQTSALPINQSAFYYYLLYPGFLLSGGHPISSIYTCLVIYLLIILFILYLVKKSILLITIYQLLITFFFISIHPQYILQGRFVWNPSLVTPFLLLSVFSFYSLLLYHRQKLLLLFSLSLAIAVSLSYSVTPVLIAMLVFLLIFSRKLFYSTVSSLLACLFFINLPTLVFELRHQFLLISSLTHGQSTKIALNFPQQFQQISTFLFSTSNSVVDKFLMLFFLLLCIILLVKNRHSVKNLSFLSSFIFIFIFLFAFIVPVPIESHYIFGFCLFLFITLSTLPRPFTLLSILSLAIIYLQLQRLSGYFRPAPHTYSQMQSCYTRFCSQISEPLFVSTQSGYLPFHNGPEHRYLLKTSGCNLKSIETENGLASNMVVVVDNSTFTQNTRYYELDLFGKFTIDSTFTCTPNLNLTVLKKAI